jgi:hypothetical protein
MKRLRCLISVTIILFTVLLTFTAAIAAEAELDLSVKQLRLDGNADFWLHYRVPDPHVISQLHAPQKQPMTLFELKYAPADWKVSYLKFSYGTTGNGNKGRGFDADWTNTSDYDEITYYGTMEFYGKQENLSIDYVRKIRESDKSITNAFAGWTQHRSSNELRDILYYRKKEKDTDKVINYDPPVSEEVFGAYYDMDFKGFRLGMEHICQVSPNLSLSGMASVNFIDTYLHGEWTNHNPIWVFEDFGNTMGYECGFEVEYRFRKAVSLNLGYTYYYAKSKNGTRWNHNKLSDGYEYGYEKSDQPTDLELAQHGYYIGISAQF